MRNKDGLTRSAFTLSVAALVIVLIALWWSGSSSSHTRDDNSQDNHPRGEPKHALIDLDKAIPIALPSLDSDLKPIKFNTPDGRTGWALKLPGGRPLATPAYWDGLLFVGGGYGSHEFYAINAETGKIAWQIKTTDDGPTAAVVEDGCVAFNTESCTVVVCDPKTGKVLWQEWLGDPLMSQPAIYRGRLYIAHPAGQRTGQSKNLTGAPEANSSSRTSHRLLCADLKTGKHIWDQPIPTDVITAPVISAGRVYFTCFDGTSFCLDSMNGSVVWKKENSGTSAPLVADGDVIMTMKVQERDKTFEGLKRIDPKQGSEKDEKLLAQSEAGYLTEDRGGLIGGGTGPGHGFGKAEAVQIDASVGFGNAPPAAKLDSANKQVGVSTVVGGWSYQGSRAAYARGQMINAQGRFLNCMRAIDGRFAWRAEVKGTNVNNDSQVFSPPSLGSQNMYLCSAQGHLLSIRQSDGKVGFMYLFKQPIAFQPTLARGNVYLATANGLLICLQAGDRDADGWYAWGGNAQHNKSN